MSIFKVSIKKSREFSETLQCLNNPELYRRKLEQTSNTRSGARASGHLRRAWTLDSTAGTGSDNELEEEKRRLRDVAGKYVNALPYPRSHRLAMTPLEVLGEFNAFYEGSVEESFSSGSSRSQ